MTQNPILIYTNHVPETTGTRFGDWKLHKADVPPNLAVFLYPCACVHLFQWADVSGDTFGYAGPLVYRFANPANCPPALFGDRGAGITTHARRPHHG